MRIEIVVYYALLMTICAHGKVKKKKKTPAERSEQPQAENVFQRQLVKEDVKASAIIKSFKSYSDAQTDVKNFNGITLSYTTPWHYDGYELAKTFRKKMNLVSPTWLSVRPRPEGGVVFGGLHDKRPGWMKEMRKGSDVKIVPRLLFEQWYPEMYVTMFGTETGKNKFADQLISLCNDNDFDGVVVEMWLSLGFMRGRDLTHLISHVGDRMKAADKVFILVIPPALGRSLRPAVTPTEVDQLYHHVDYFSVMTYDYSSPAHPGPMAPLVWMKECIEYLAPGDRADVRKKLLLGVNFYGMRATQGEAGEMVMNGEVYTNILDKFTPKFHWDSQIDEHVGKYTDESGKAAQIWYPTLLSIQKRLDLARELGVAGVAIWEIGQGLDYFFDLL